MSNTNGTTHRPFSEQGHYTSVHDSIFDVVMPYTPPNAFKVLMFVLRKTRGWKKDEDRLSYSQIMQGTGIKNRSTLSSAIDWLTDKKLILRWDEHGQVMKRQAARTGVTFSLNRDFQLKEPSPENGPGATPENGLTRTTPQEPSITSTDVDVADANPDQPEEPKPITAQTIAATLYDTSKAVTGVRWDKDEFGYHIGRAEEMLSKDDPTLEEIEELPTAFLKVMGYQGQRADAVTALREIRVSRHMEKVQNETQAEKARRREERREALRAEYANKEAPWERSQPKKTQAEMEAREAERQEELRQMAEARSKRRQS